MTFQIHNLPYAPFAPYFDMTDEELRAHHAVKRTVTHFPSAPCRVSLADATVGETVILLNHASLTGPTPYAATQAIYVRQDAPEATPAPNTVPDVLQRRTLSVRAFGADGLMRSGDVVDGASVAPRLNALLDDPDIAEIHLHFAGAGCFAARVTRQTEDMVD